MGVCSSELEVGRIGKVFDLVMDLCVGVSYMVVIGVVVPYMVVVDVVVVDVDVAVVCVLARRKRVKAMKAGVKNMITVGFEVDCLSVNECNGFYSVRMSGMNASIGEL